MDALDQAKFDHLKAAWLSGLSQSKRRAYEAGRSIHRKAKRTRSVMV